MSWLEQAARRMALISGSRRRRIAISFGLSIVLGLVLVVVLRATGGADGPWYLLIMVGSYAVLFLCGRILDGMATGRYAGRPLDLPRARMMRDAARYYTRVTSWTSPLTAEEALGRLIERMRVPHVRTQAYDGALWIRMVQTYQVASPADPELPSPAIVEAEVLVFVDDLPRAEHDSHGSPERTAVTVHHQVRRATGLGATMLDDPSRAATMTDHLLIAVRDATGD
ncbi:hypothetical protein GCM10011512_13380 [Tersicoccus solisilvae]|uniref:Uncharacterized protein n=1 Tax=Tersicoccus solisilvae TaxID=1882339 RepID=A0ABQ1P2P0_9MICC|nr:hypothetical protein [Tersicoccus solisilvae]GGC87750.1 hypothetical protein GCM10011512_13380 [Tersicoccus solisilvae]